MHHHPGRLPPIPSHNPTLCLLVRYLSVYFPHFLACCDIYNVETKSGNQFSNKVALGLLYSHSDIYAATILLLLLLLLLLLYYYMYDGCGYQKHLVPHSRVVGASVLSSVVVAVVTICMHAVYVVCIRVLSPCPLLRFTFAGLRLHDGHDEVVLGHEVVLGDERREAVAQVRLVLELVEYPPVVEVGVREDPVDAPTHRPQLRHRRVLDGHATRKVFVAVQQARRPVQSVSRVVDGRTLLRSLVGRAQEDPLLRGDHLVARAGEALRLQPHRQSIELHAELSGREKGGGVNEERISLAISEVCHCNRSER